MAVKTSSAATDALSDNLSFEMDPRSIVELARGAARQARAAAAAGRGGSMGGGTGGGASACTSPAWRDGIRPGVRVPDRYRVPPQTHCCSVTPSQ